MMKYLQRLGKALMLPVACLPICGILMGLGYALAPGAMAAGGEYATSGLAYTIGFFLIKAGGALIDNMSWLFAVGVAVGMAKDKDGTAGLAGLVSWLMITKLLDPAVVATLSGVAAENVDPAFSNIQTQFIGILAGLIGAACYNRFKDTKLPDWLSFFSGKRCVAIITAVISLVVAAILFFVWRSFTAHWYGSASRSCPRMRLARVSTRSSTACSFRSACTTRSTTYSGSIPSASAT